MFVSSKKVQGMFAYLSDDSGLVIEKECCPKWKGAPRVFHGKGRDESVMTFYDLKAGAYQ